jgi:hypothetical protein
MSACIQYRHGNFSNWAARQAICHTTLMGHPGLLI